MAGILSNAHIEFIVNGFRWVGLPEEDRPFEFPGGEDFFDLSTGADGGTYGTTTPMLGGLFIARAEPNSPSVAWALGENAYRKQAVINRTAFRIYEATYNDVVQGRTANMQGGLLQQCPDMSEPGQTFEVGFYFDLITPVPESGVWLPPRTYAA